MFRMLLWDIFPVAVHLQTSSNGYVTEIRMSDYKHMCLIPNYENNLHQRLASYYSLINKLNTFIKLLWVNKSI